MIIPGFSRYDIDEHGTVVDTLTGEVSASYINTYPTVRLIPDGGTKKKQIAVHTLLAAAFLPEHKPGTVVALLDGDKTNIELSNIAWLTRSELSSRYYNRQRKEKQNNTNTEYTRQMVLNALEVHDAPVSMIELSSELQVPYATVRYSMLQLISERKAMKTEEGYIIA